MMAVNMTKASMYCLLRKMSPKGHKANRPHAYPAFLILFLKWSAAFLGSYSRGLHTNLLQGRYRRRLFKADIECIRDLVQDWLHVVQVRHGDGAGLSNE